MKIGAGMTEKGNAKVSKNFGWSLSGVWLLLQRLFEKERHCTNKKCCRPISHTRENGYPVGVSKPIDILDSRFHGNDRKNPL